MSRLKENEKLEKMIEGQPQGKEEATKTQELDPQPSLGSYYNLLEGGRIIPQKLSIPLFFELEKERIRSHRWMQITKSRELRILAIWRTNSEKWAKS